MKNLLYAVGAVIVSLGLSFVFFGHQVEQRLGSYIPPSNPGGFLGTYSTTSTIPAFCGFSSLQVINTTATITLTTAAATSSYANCGQVNPGGNATLIVVNDSTNTVKIAGGTGVTLLNETTGPGTTTILGTINTVPATSTSIFASVWDTSSTQYVAQGQTTH